jgi:choline dehydrogenase-like flavoprotein
VNPSPVILTIVCSPVYSRNSWKSMQQEAFDVIIVGSGVAGGAAAQQFCEAGFKVLVLEAGTPASSAACDTQTLQTLPIDQPVQARCYAFSANTNGYFINDSENPYGAIPGQPFSWIRARTVGGKSLLWAGHCYRMGDIDFTAALRDGVGEAWPLRYAEIEPYYDLAERLLQVGNAHPSLSNTDGENNSGLAIVERRLQAACSGNGLGLIPSRVSHARSQPGRPARCIHCGQTSEACLRPVTSYESTLAAGLRTGRLTLWTQAQVHTVLVDSSGKASGVAWIRRSTGEHFEAAARVIFLCASALESTRILLNSSSPRFPHGLGNSSGVLGHYLMDHVSGVVIHAAFDNEGSLPQENGRAGMFYVPRWQNLGNQRDHPFLRGYGYQGFIMRSDHDLLPCGRTEKKAARDQTGEANRDNAIAVRLVAFGEMLPNNDNYVEIDKDGDKDVLGIPVPGIDCHHRENETAMAQDMVSSGIELLEGAGGQITEIQNVAQEPGLAIHEAGTCRMGEDPKSSVLNPFNQCHDAPNVFVTDASCFPSIGTQNPALTIMALTIRACRYAIQQLVQHKI